MTISRRMLAVVLPAFAMFLTACQSNIQPLKPLLRVEVWVPDDGSAAIELTKPEPVPPPQPVVAADEDYEPTTQPTTLPAKVNPVDVASRLPETQPATVAASEPASAPATQTAETQPVTAPDLAATEPAPVNLPPGKRVVKIIDPNQTSRFVYKASYDNIWQQAMQLLTRTGFALDRRDYRLGVITTQPLPSAQFLEFWKPQQAGFINAMENTINNQRRLLRLTISPVPGKPDFYAIAIQVLVERETNPSETIGGPVFIEGSGFGRNAFTLRSDYAGLESSRWITLGHDPKLEKKLLDQLFLRI